MIIEDKEERTHGGVENIFLKYKNSEVVEL